MSLCTGELCEDMVKAENDVRVEGKEAWASFRFLSMSRWRDESTVVWGRDGCGVALKDGWNKKDDGGQAGEKKRRQRERRKCRAEKDAFDCTAPPRYTCAAHPFSITTRPVMREHNGEPRQSYLNTQVRSGTTREALGACRNSISIAYGLPSCCSFATCSIGLSRRAKPSKRKKAVASSSDPGRPARLCLVQSGEALCIPAEKQPLT